jgi:hypothetical protein
MAAVPVILNGVLMPKGKAAGDKPVPAVFTGYLSIQGLEIGGGPILPDDPPPEPAHPIVIPDPPVDPPIDPPTNPPPNAVIILKPAPVTGGWGLATDASGAFQWYFVPGGAGPKR